MIVHYLFVITAGLKCTKCHKIAVQPLRQLNSIKAYV